MIQRKIGKMYILRTYGNKVICWKLNNEAIEQIDEIYSLDKLVLDHTMYPQYGRFIPLAEKKEALYRLGHNSCDVHYLFPVLPRNEGGKISAVLSIVCEGGQRNLWGSILA